MNTLRKHQELLGVLLLAVISMFITAAWMHPFVNSFTIQPFGDQAWTQAQAQAAIQAGPFGTTFHAGWSAGFNPWQYPTGTSIGFLTISWLVGLFGVGSSNALVAVMGITAASISVGTYLAIRLAAPGRTHPMVAWLLAASIGLSPYVLSKTGHYTVAAFTLLPATIAFLGYLQRRPPRRNLIWASVVFALVVLTATLWWLLITLYLLVVGLIIAAVLRNRTWLRYLGITLLATGVGAVLPLSLAVVNRVPGSTWNRQPWDSTVFGGSLTDFLAASPLLRALFPGLDLVLPGTSAELSSLGLIPSLAGIVAIVLSLTAFLGYREETRRQAGWLFVTLQVALLSFVSLGLGTLQEAVLLLVDVESPLRAWSRLIILIALLGTVLIAPALSRPVFALRRKPALGVLAIATVAVLSLIVLDARSIVQMDPRGLPTIEEGPAVEQLKQSAPDCPVAQLPVGTFPDFPMADGTPTALTYYYRGFVPYLLNPAGMWSFGAVKGAASDTLLRDLPATLTSGDLTGLRDAGYCAVLYDTHYAQWMHAKDASWPASTTQGLTPAWSDDRFSIYRLN